MMELNPEIFAQDAFTEVYKNLMNRALGYFRDRDQARAELFCNMASHTARAYHRPLWAAFARECAQFVGRQIWL